MALLRYMLIDEDGQRIGRFESAEIDWRSGDVFEFDDQSWRIVEILPEVSTMVAYNAVWIAVPATSDEDDDVTGSSPPVGFSAGAGQ